ncbi:2Fe-2S iron-sulfur cluster-binding protein [Hoyosella subflava]|uniref:2Fe-2S iron-sulfur cluster-binding protein n=1 Tax=Hoyosella subflava TaxID=639313 RepID=UPI0003085B9C|nr:2Fe-2S iron-sulfur cluster-binding protein [Hoyosella subflava]
MDSVRELWASEGLGGALHVEQFTAPVRTVGTQDAEGRVTFTATNTSVPNSGRTLLEQAEDAGLAPEYGCRMGICFSCTRRKDAGTTRNMLTGAACSESGKTIQICVATPVGDVSIDL